MRLRRTIAMIALLLPAACDSTERNALDDVAEGANSSAVEHKVEAEAQAVMEPLAPPVPGTPGGLPAQPRKQVLPSVEGSIDPKSAQGAAQVVQGYYALLEEKRFADAMKQWGDAGVYGSTDADAFAKRFAGFSEIHANIGAPGESDGAAGSIFITVPVQIYARIGATGKPWYALRRVTLRRVNDVDGSTEAQRRWHIERVAAYASPEPAKENPAPSG